MFESLFQFVRKTLAGARIFTWPNKFRTEQVGPIQKLAAGPWRSLGGYFDYSAWTDRERFRELDRAIAKAEGRDGIQDEPEGQII